MLNSSILVIDDDESIIRTFKAYLDKHGYTSYGAVNYDTAMDILSREQIDVVISDIILGKHTGLDILKEVKLRGVNSPVIMITGEPDVETASASVRFGAFDYITKPISKDTFIRITKHAIQYKAFLDEKEVIEREKERYQSHIEAIFQSVEEAIVTVDNMMCVSHANFALDNICKIQSVIGRTVASIRNKCNLKCWKIFGEALRSNNFIREYRMECEHVLNPHQVVLLNVTPLKDKDDAQIGGVMTIRDITRLSDLENALKNRVHFQNIVGKNKKMQDIYKFVDILKDIDTTVLITGPSGTGKELVARAIHHSGERAHKPFVVVNCSALADNLLESELFGHVKGAFTGAVSDKTGRFQLASNGTIFLDEIGDISQKIQLKLLRVLEAKEYERVGDSSPIKMNARIITATNKDLQEKVKRGDFREDIYYRLKVVEINMPSLQEKRDDISLLVDHYISSFNSRFNKHIMGISNEVQKLFMEYNWPGNIRELIHVLEHAFVVCEEPTIEITHLPREITGHLHGYVPNNNLFIIKKIKIQKEDILDALEKTGWNKVQAARVLGISRPNLYKRMKDYDICNNPE
jgi:two-component system, NtrC family, response regulator HydG